MFILKIIVISSVILNIGFAATQCNSDQALEFLCKNPKCMGSVEDESTMGQLLTSSKSVVSIVGYNNDRFLVKNNKGKLDIVPKNNLKLTRHTKGMNNWEFKVHINKKTSDICELGSQSGEENYNDSNIAQINTNIDNTIIETQQQGTTNSGSLQDITKTVNQQGNNNYLQLPLLEKEKAKIKAENSIVNNVLSVKHIGDNLQDNTSTINEIQKEPNVSNGIDGTSDNLPLVSDNYKEPASQNTREDYLPKVGSTTLNSDTVSDKIAHSSPLPGLMNETEIVSSTNYQATVGGKVDVTEMLNKKSVDQCTSESDCLHSVDSISKYESIPHQYKPETDKDVYKTMEPGNNEKSKEFEPKSFVASFGHPDTCSGISCLKFKRNVEKTNKTPQPLNHLPKQVYPDSISPSINTDFEEENQNIIINEITEQSDTELSLFDHLQNWISSPTSNTIDFLWNIFGVNSKEYSDVFPEQSAENKKMFKHISHSELYFIVVAVVTLLFSLIYYKYQKGTYENYLLTMLAAKDQSLLIVEKELSLLKEHGSGNTKSTLEKNSEIDTLNDHLTKSENIISSQALRIEKLEQEVEELTENGMEMHTLLSSTLKSGTKTAEKLNSVKAKLVDSENLVAALTQKNFDKTTELEKKNDIIKSLQSDIDEVTNKNINLVEDNGKLSSQIEEIINKNILKESKLLGEINSLQFELDKKTNALVTAKNEVSLSKNALQEILSQKISPADAKTFLSSVKLSAELKSAKQMSEGYKQKLDESLKSNKQYLDHIDVLKSDIVKFEDKFSKLEEKKEESVNKLNILTKFFKEQEKEYLKQINEKAMLCDNKEGKSNDLNERIKCLNQEIANYKSEIQSLKKEITDQEASFKIQISAADKKASDYWISFRQVERKLKEMELETAQLRNKLTMVDKKLENGTKSIDSSKDFEDELLDIPLPIVSPDFTLLDFEPPPPIFSHSSLQHDPLPMFSSSSLQHASVDQRLPPLGALGQASSPPVPTSRRHNRSLSPSSPPPSQRSSVFRPLPQRYNYMNRQNSLGHSVESLDK